MKNVEIIAQLVQQALQRWCPRRSGPTFDSTLWPFAVNPPPMHLFLPNPSAAPLRIKAQKAQKTYMG